MEKQVFAGDPFIGCPFDDSKMQMVESWKGLSLGDLVEFEGLNDRGIVWLQGEIIAIGENARYLNGCPFVAFAIRVGTSTYLKTHREVHHVKGGGRCGGISCSTRG